MLYKTSQAIFVDKVSKTYGGLSQSIQRRVSRLNGRSTDKLHNDWVKPTIVAVEQVSFSVREGEIFGLVGRDGSGKSTLIRMLATLLLPDSGDIRIFGYDTVRQPAQVQRLINPAYSDASFFKKASPLKNLLYSTRINGLSSAEGRSQIIELLVRLGLEPQAIDTPMEEMPRCQQQVVSVARALLSSPRVLLLDEPFIGLDLTSLFKVQQVLHEMRDEHGTTVVIATPEIVEASGLFDRIALLESGKLVATGAPEETEWYAPCLVKEPFKDVCLELSG